MTDRRDDPRSAAGPDPGDSSPAAQRTGGVPDTPVPNPLRPSARRRVAQWLEEIADGVAELLAAGAQPNDVDEGELDRAEWVRRTEEVIAQTRRAAALIDTDPLPFSAAAQARNLLSRADRHDLVAAGAALDAALAAVIPERLKAFAREEQRRLDEHGFVVQGVLGQGEPAPLPGFTYTIGLGKNASHPELVIVGIDHHVAAALLADVSTQILAGERSLRAGEDLDGLSRNGYKLRVRQCPPHLVEQTHPDPTNPVGVLQLLVPDEAGRFPGDADVDPEYERAQEYPEYF